ncbi:hypothetical protein [Catenibacillus scindens]|uniref:rhomboid family intramembrane serine protease n=1 Tax=Catenibacillus scindens TaxID=673271 RepID=UPI0032096F78
MLDKLERKFGRYAIKNLMRYIIVLYAIGFFLSFAMPEVYYTYFCLDAERILHGEVWRIFTFLLNSPSNNPIFVIFSLYFYYLLGNTLEQVWGAFRFNLYYFTGVIGTVLAAIIVYLVTGLSGLYFYMDTYYINLSLFLAFATIIPDMQVLVMFIIPVRMKWLAILDVVLLAWSFIQGGWGTRVAIVVALINFLFYFISFMRKKGPSPRQIHRKYVYKKAAAKGYGASAGYRGNRGTSPKGAGPYPGGARHRCAVCGRTELDDDTLEFRYCSKCNGNYEYCQDHLFTHTHVK